MSDLGLAVGRRHEDRSGDQPDGDRWRGSEPGLDRPLERIADDGGRRERQRDQQQPAEIEPAERVADLVAERDQERRRGSGVERHLEGLAQLRIEPVVLPAEQPRDERDVPRGRDREQLGRAVQGAEGERLADRKPRVGPATLATLDKAGHDRGGEQKPGKGTVK